MAIMTLSPKKIKKNNEPLTMTLDARISTEVSEKACEEILKTLEATPFAQLSYPVNAYRRQIEANVAEDDDRVVTVGYVSGYNPETREFSVVVFKNSRSVIETLVNPVMEIAPDIHDGTFIRVVKFNIYAEGEDGDEDEGLDNPPEIPRGVVMQPEETDPAE